MRFTADEIAAIRKFLDWAADEWLDGYSDGLTGCGGDGPIITEWTSYSDYDGGSSMERETRFIPWLAMTDPEEYERQEGARKAEEARQYEAQKAAQVRANEIRERELLRILEIKYRSE